MVVGGLVCTVLAKKANDDLWSVNQKIGADPTHPDKYRSEWDDADARLSRNRTLSLVFYGLGGAALAGSAWLRRGRCC